MKNDDDSAALFIRPGALPSYTGWGRPESTLAPFFRIVEFPANGHVQADTDVTLVLECQGHAECFTSSPAFYVRAYGPSITTGRVQRASGRTNQYKVSFRPIDPGSYTVEIVLTFSNLPSFDIYPLSDKEAYNEFLYEGYNIAGSPLQLYVHGDASPSPQELPLCKPHQLVVEGESFSSSSSPDKNGANDRARWKTVDQVNHEDHQFNSHLTKNVTLQGYQQSLNSLGVVMDYQFKDCRIMPEPTSKVNLFQWVRQPIHVILIGDSTFRLQEKILQSYTAFNPIIRISFLELYGGYFKTQMLTGPNVRQFLQEQQQQSTVNTSITEQRVILFNTGLHDIHRLCGGSEMIDDRQTYLRSDMPSSCVEMYKIAVETLARDVAALPDKDVKIFQTTTAAWPKHGNYGVAWDPRYGQPLPLDTSFVEYFNEVATRILRQKFPQVQIVDGYYISYARPDNREIDFKSALGKKLSHPGAEVMSAMVRTWSMLFLQQLNII